jgi:putative transposase
MGAMGAIGAMGAMGAIGAMGAMGAMGAIGAMGAMGASPGSRSGAREPLHARPAASRRGSPTGRRNGIVTWTERTYHRRRRQAALGRLTPVEYETIMTTPAAQAA